MTTLYATPVTPLPRPARTSIAARILDAFPTGTYALTGLLRLMDIVETDSVPSAAVQCRAQPKLLINPDFVQCHAQTPEKLVMLVMHELHHVLLGHTTLFARLTAVHNFVFDAVINGLVCRMFPEPAYTSFFTGLYRADAFPECLLRPPPGWPQKISTAPGIDDLPEPQRQQVAAVHAALYSEAGASYKEVFDTLPVALAGSMCLAGIPLLGNHEDEGSDGQLERVSPVLFDAVRELVEKWPQPPEPIKGRSLAELLNESTVKARRPPSARAVLRRLIRHVAQAGQGHGVRRSTLGETSIATPIPMLARRSLVQRVLGYEPVLYPGIAPWRERRPVEERVHVYLDVSGSVDAIKDALYGALLDSQEWIQMPVHVFSNEVADISRAELRRGVCRSTGGTDIGCVAAHMAAHRVRRALIITDGWVGPPQGEHHHTLQQARLAVAFVGQNINQHDLAEVANHHAILPLGETA